MLTEKDHEYLSRLVKAISLSKESRECFLETAKGQIPDKVLKVISLASQKLVE
jgi:hypothetical protein